MAVAIAPVMAVAMVEGAVVAAGIEWLATSLQESMLLQFADF
jgi:hypothetical protein